HIPRVQPPTLVVQRAREHVEFAPHRHVRRRQRGLCFPHVVDQRLQIVHSAENVLGSPQTAQIARGARVGRFSSRGRQVGRELQYVAQLLQRDPDGVQPLPPIHALRLTSGG